MAKKSEELTAEEISALENKKNYYEKWRDKELPPELQSSVDSFASFAKLPEEKVFRAGWRCALYEHDLKKEGMLNADDKIFDYLNAIILIAETVGTMETQSIRTIAIDASNYLTRNYVENTDENNETE
ncbi:MAG: hypothetical protein J5647_14245 [Spirochaetaceae bacterium]|nr:hypothetical protein [Spirochaetaceae bacterium]